MPQNEWLGVMFKDRKRSGLGIGVTEVRVVRASVQQVGLNANIGAL